MGAIEESLKKTGINKDNAKKVLEAWKKAVGENETLTPETLRKVGGPHLPAFCPPACLPAKPVLPDRLAKAPCLAPGRLQVLLKQSAKTTGLVLIQVLLDLGAAYGAQARLGFRV